MKTLVIALLLVVNVSAGLEWKETEATLEVHPVQVAATALFAFANNGQQTITIETVDVSCSCLAPSLSRQVFRPGEKGEVGIRFNLEERTGPQRKKATVVTHDGKREELWVSVEIPKLYTVSPVMMTWPEGSKRMPKTARLLNPNPQPIKLLHADSSHKDVAVELKAVRDGFEYEVLVAPTPAASNARSVVRIQPECPPGLDEAKIVKFYVHVQ